MIEYVPYIVLLLSLWLFTYVVYVTCNHGLAPNALRQQLFRYFMASACSVVPVAVFQADVCQPSIVMALVVSALWVVTYPLLFHLTNRKNAPDYDHQLDGAFGIYVFGWVSGLMLLLPILGPLWGLLVLALLFLPLAQWGYYFTCHACIDSSGMKMLQETHYNEIIEFLHSYPLWRTILLLTGVVGLVGFCVWLPFAYPAAGAVGGWLPILLTLGMVVFISIYVWKPNHGVFSRTGIARLFQVVRDYVRNNSTYIENQQERMRSLDVKPLSELSAPHTILMVIGESASRDFMSAFSPVDVETTPWMTALSKDEEHCTIFRNAYSCDIQTVPTLEQALTECNQYDGGEFYKSCSIVDMAHAAGYAVHWYSNQGHLGAADTPITLVANTSEVAKWTLQELNKPQYDETLIDFLDELDPTKNNFLVLHLKGSHFNYENRFTESMRQWGEPGNHDKVTNYKNTLFYTDSVLHKAFDYCRERLGLAAMVYFSDHADVPDRHRQPNFGGFRDTRIPLMIWTGDEFLAKRPARAKAIKDNKERYWTNDLAYDLMCGVFDLQSSHFKEENSLASSAYKFTREDLTAMHGSIRIADDQHVD